MDSNLQSAYVLHYRNYRETSFLVELLTKYAGRISVIARGAKRAKSPLRGLIQPFMPLTIAWRGRSSLPTLQTAELRDKPIVLRDKKLFSGFYLNELLTYILHRHSPCESIFTLYENALLALNAGEFTEIILRQFEKNLLTELGYALQFNHEAHSENPIAANKSYLFIPHEGFSYVQSVKFNSNNHAIFNGKSILKIAADDFADKQTLRDAKRLLRFALQPLLNGKPIKSRELFS